MRICGKCKKELGKEAIFCSHCGEKVIDGLFDSEKTIKTAQNVWFFVGFLNGFFPKEFKSITKNMKEESTELYQDYMEAINFTKKQLKPYL